MSPERIYAILVGLKIYELNDDVEVTIRINGDELFNRKLTVGDRIIPFTPLFLSPEVYFRLVVRNDVEFKIAILGEAIARGYVHSLDEATTWSIPGHDV